VPVLYREHFDNYAAQRNYGLNDISYKHDWLLMVDADEAVPSELVAEMQAQLKNGGKDTTIYRMRRKDHFLGNGSNTAVATPPGSAG